MKFDLSLYVSHSGEDFGCWVEMNADLARNLLRYKRLTEIIALPYVFIVVEKPYRDPLIVETEWPVAIGLEEFSIKVTGVHIGVIDENGTALSTEGMSWEFLHRVAEEGT
jgi:hypothetical protein